MRNLKIAYGNSRMDKQWKNNEISWPDFCARVKSTKRTTETVEEYRKLKKGAQDNIKDVGGFVGGHLKSGKRRKGSVLCRSMLTLDMDYGVPSIWDDITMLFSFCYGIEEAIDKFLGNVYAPSAMTGRYDYIPADSSAGVSLLPAFAESHVQIPLRAYNSVFP